MFGWIARRYLTGRLAAASLALGSPGSGGVALIVHSLTWMMAVVVPVFVLAALASLALGDSPVGSGLAFALVAAGMVPTAFMMLETARALQVLLGGRTQAAALHARLHQRLAAMREGRHE